MKTEIKYGLITGISVCLYVMLEYLLGFHTTRPEIGKYSGSVGAIFPIIFIILALKERRDINNGVLRFGEGILSAVTVSLISAVIITVFFLAYNNYINPGWQEHILDWERSRSLAQGVSHSQTDAYVEQQRRLMTGITPYVTMFILSPILGAVVGLIATAILRRKPAAGSANSYGTTA